MVPAGKTDYVAVRQQSDLQLPSVGNAALVVLAASRLGVRDSLITLKFEHCSKCLPPGSRQPPEYRSRLTLVCRVDHAKERC